MLKPIAAFEWRYHTRQVTFVASVLLFGGMGFVLSGTGFGPPNVNLNSPFVITESAGIVSLFAVFVAAAFCGNAIVRDREYRMEEIVFTTSVEKLEFLLGRFAGSFAAVYTAYAAAGLGLLAGRLMPWHDASRLGPVVPGDYLRALLVVGLPSVLFASVVIFAVAALSRSVLASYTASVFIYFLYWGAAALTNSPLMARSVPGATSGSSIGAVLDPFALAAFFDQTQYWTPLERNVRNVALTGTFLANRLLWVGVSALVFAAVYRMFSFRVSRGAGARSVADVEQAVTTAIPARRQVAVAPSAIRALISTSRIELRAALGNLPFVALTLLWGGLVASEIISDVQGGELGSSFVPTAGFIAHIVRQPLSLMGMIVIIYYGAELVWRERMLRFDGIVDATPPGNGVFVVAKWSALCAIAAVLTAVAFGVGVGVQIAYGHGVEPGVLLAFAGISLLPLMLFAAIAILIQTHSPQKYLGMVLVLLAAVASQRADILGLEHPLLRFADAPTPAWSAFTGFMDLGAWLWPMVWWSALSGLALIAAAALRRRDSRRLRVVPTAVLVAIAVAAGAVVFVNTNVVDQWESEAQLLEWKADYEKSYRAWAARPVPRIRAVTAVIDLDPERRSYRVRGEYLLRNEGSGAIDVMLLAVRRDARAATIRVDGAKVTRDPRFNHYVVSFSPPIAPGDRRKLAFDVRYETRGFGGAGNDYTVTDNGSYVMSFRSFPTIGYRQGYEIEDERERRRRGLPGAASRTTETGEVASGDWATFDVTVSTAAGQKVVAPGSLVRSWSEGQRAFWRFRSQEPIPNQFAIASARYAVARSTQDGVDIEIFYHPAHAMNVERIARAARESLRLFTQQFGPYPHRHLRIAEVPLFWEFGGFAQPGVVFLQEQRGFLLDPGGAKRFDLLYRRVAHEVAHQWWGHQLVAAGAPGATMLTESLTKYSELLALEKAYGTEQVEQSLESEHNLYLGTRTRESGTEPPLAQSRDQSYLYYRKGAVVMWAIRDLIGEEALHRALRDLVKEQGGAERKPTTAHLLAQLKRHSTPEQDALIDEWMNRVVLYDLAIAEASARAVGGGRHEVTFRLEFSKEGGRPLAEPVTVEVLGPDGVTSLLRTKTEVTQGTTALTFVVPSRPRYVVVDPSFTRLDRKRSNNVKEIVAE